MSGRSRSAEPSFSAGAPLFHYLPREPYSALLLNSRWDILKANRGHCLLWEAMTDEPLEASADRHNLLMAAFDPDGLRPNIANWDRVV